MASIFQRTGSSFFWIKYRDTASGKQVRRSTGIPIGRPDSKQRAKRMEAEYTHKEMSAPKTREKDRFEAWADDYLATRYRNEGTLRAARMALVDLMAFFRAHDIRVPRQVSYQHAAGFVRWRTSGAVLAKVHVNTAQQRFTTFSVLMGEAVRRGLAEYNPCREVRTQRVASREKQEITPQDQAIIERELAFAPQWMRDQWLILMRQGCRIAETNIPIDRIDTQAMTVRIKIKGGKMHTQSLHPDLLPIVARAVSEGRATLLDAPTITSWSSVWCAFFKDLGMPYSAHSCRVTVITRLLRAGHSPVMVCNFISHTLEVNRIYRRLKPHDSASLLATLGASPSLPTSNGGQQSHPPIAGPRGREEA